MGNVQPIKSKHDLNAFEKEWPKLKKKYVDAIECFDLLMTNLQQKFMSIGNTPFNETDIDELEIDAVEAKKMGYENEVEYKEALKKTLKSDDSYKSFFTQTAQESIEQLKGLSYKFDLMLAINEVNAKISQLSVNELLKKTDVYKKHFSTFSSAIKTIDDNSDEKFKVKGSGIQQEVTTIIDKMTKLLEG